MQLGDSFVRVADNQPPLKSALTKTVLAASACGLKLASKEVGYSVDEAGVVETAWLLEAGKKMNFSPEFDAETIDFAEFKRRIESKEWCEANSEHPIAYLGAFIHKLKVCGEELREMKPAARIRKGKSVVTIPHDETPERRKQLLSFLK